MRLPVALTIAGSDSGGGAGIQADLKTFAVLGVHGTSAITAITAQNTTGVTDILELPVALVSEQIAVVVEDMGVQAAKTGMLSSAAIIATVADAVQRYQIRNLVVDPVMVAKGGAKLLRDDAVAAMRERLIPLAAVVTPNLPEAAALLGREIQSLEERRQAARDLVAMGARVAVVKAGHAEADVIDVYFDGSQLVELSGERIQTPNTHGSAVAYPPRPHRGGSSTALGIVLVVIGLFALVVVLSGVDLTESGWPLFIIIPGITLVVVGFLRVGAVATIPGGIVTMLGVVLAYCNSTGDWPFWAYGWSLVVPFGIGLGMYLQALRDRDQHALRSGRTLLFISLIIFLIGFVLFESILGISGRDYFGPVGKAALPVLLILVGIILLVRSVQRSRHA